MSWNPLEVLIDNRNAPMGRVIRRNTLMSRVSDCFLVFYGDFNRSKMGAYDYLTLGIPLSIIEGAKKLIPMVNRWQPQTKLAKFFYPFANFFVLLLSLIVLAENMLLRPAVALAGTIACMPFIIGVHLATKHKRQGLLTDLLSVKVSEPSDQNSYSQALDGLIRSKRPEMVPTFDKVIHNAEDHYSLELDDGQILFFNISEDERTQHQAALDHYAVEAIDPIPSPMAGLVF